MANLAPLTKLFYTLAVSACAVILKSVPALAVLAVVQFVVAVAAGVAGKAGRAMAALAVFSAGLAGLQYLFGGDAAASLAGGLRMQAMTSSFVLVMSTTRIQSLTTALVSQCRVPYEYAFMFTAALRFVPDLLAEVKAVQEAQACRGYAPKGVAGRLLGYLAVVQPLVLRSVGRSETMAMTMELRGFGLVRGRSFVEGVSLASRDYCALAAMLAAVAGVIALRLA